MSDKEEFEGPAPGEIDNDFLLSLPNQLDGKGMGALFDKPDSRDLVYMKEFPVKDSADLPLKIDLRADMPPIWDQESLGSCTAQAAIGCSWFQQWKQGDKVSPPLSRLQNYYESRVAIGMVNEDSGATVRYAFKNLISGGCPEPYWPYIIQNYKEAPPSECLQQGEKWQALKYFSIPRKLNPGYYDESILNPLMTSLAEGYPIAYSQFLYGSFQPNKQGIIPDPNTKYEQLMGGHAMMIVGYSQPSQTFIIRNSWGTEWGGFWNTKPGGEEIRLYGGYARVSFKHMGTHGRDFWFLREVELGK